MHTDLLFNWKPLSLQVDADCGGGKDGDKDEEVGKVEEVEGDVAVIGDDEDMQGVGTESVGGEMVLVDTVVRKGIKECQENNLVTSALPTPPSPSVRSEKKTNILRLSRS